MSVHVAVDVLLGLILVGLAAQVAIGRHLFRSIVFFVAFGLAMAVIWARLGAPDLALADAAIGAGLTGALMMVAFRRLVAIDPAQARAQANRSSVIAAVIGVMAAGMVATIGLTALTLEQRPGQAGLQVARAFPVRRPEVEAAALPAFHIASVTFAQVGEPLPLPGAPGALRQRRLETLQRQAEQRGGLPRARPAAAVRSPAAVPCCPSGMPVPGPLNCEQSCRQFPCSTAGGRVPDGGAAGRTCSHCMGLLALTSPQGWDRRGARPARRSRSPRPAAARPAHLKPGARERLA